mgnify:CR=1|jgi:hypothetical protein
MTIIKNICLLILIAIFSCSKKDVLECPDNIACTEVFVSIGVKIVNSNNEIVNCFKTVTEIEGQVNPIVNNIFDIAVGPYIILDDSQKSKLKKDGSKVIFTAYNEKDQVIAAENFVIGHDCCHVVKISGPESITVK